MSLDDLLMDVAPPVNTLTVGEGVQAPETPRPSARGLDALLEPTVPLPETRSEFLNDDQIISAIDVIRNPEITNEQFLNSGYFSRKLDMPIRTAYDLRYAVGSMLDPHNTNPSDLDIASIIKDIELEEFRLGELEQGLGFWGRLWETSKYKMFNKRDIEGKISRGPFLNLALGEIPIGEVGDKVPVDEAAKAAWYDVGGNLSKEVIGRVQMIADTTGNEKLNAWSGVMASGLDAYFAENPHERANIKPGAGVLGTVIQAVKRPEILVDATIKMMPMVSEGYLGGKLAGPLLGKKPGTIVGIAEGMFGQNYHDIRKNQPDVGKAFAQAILTTYGEAALEEWSLSAKVDLFKKGFGEWAKKSMAKRSVDIVLTGGKAGARGFTEEGGQTWNSRFWQLIFTDGKTFADAAQEAFGPEVSEAAGLGMIMEMTLGGASFMAGKMASAAMMIPSKVKIDKINGILTQVAATDALTPEQKVEITQVLVDKRSEVQAGLDNVDTYIADSVEEAKELEADWEAIEKAADEALLTSLAMICPFAPEEKQALLESDGPLERAELLTTLLEMAALEADGPPNIARH